MNKYLFPLLAIALTTSTVCAADLKGVVKDPTAASQPKYVVTLTPPRASNMPKQVTSTSSSGEYHLGNISSGRYLLEVSDDTKILHREVIEVQGDEKKNVELKRQ